MKKRNKRSSVKYPNLDPALNLKTRQDLIDFDYLDKLNEKELKWLNQFVDEEINANFPKYRRRVLPKKEIVVELKSGKKKKKDYYKTESYKRNNSRNVDIYTRAKASGALAQIEDINATVKNPEGKLIKAIDRRLKKRK